MKFVDWCILSSLVFGFWVFDACVTALLDPPIFGEYVIVVTVGICIGQINLIGAWGALAPGKVIVRLPWAAFLGVSMWQAIVIGQHIEGGFSRSDQVNVGVSIGFGVVATQVPLWLARWPFGWRLLPPRFEIDKVAETDAQFNLKHLFLGMFFAALSLAMVRVIFGETSLADFGIQSELLIMLPVVAICNALVTAPCLWLAFLSRRRMAAWMAGGTAYVVLISAAELLTLTLILGPPGGSENFVMVFTCLNVAQCLTVFATMVLLRTMGFQLVRTRAARHFGPLSRVVDA